MLYLGGGGGGGCTPEISAVIRAIATKIFAPRVAPDVIYMTA